MNTHSRISPVALTRILGVVIVSGVLLVASASFASQLEEMAVDIELLREDLEKMKAESAGFEDIEARLANSKSRIEDMRDTIIAKEEALKDKAYLLGIYKSAFRAQTTLAKGSDLGTIKLDNGTTYEGCVFAGLRGTVVNLVTKTGNVSVSIADLPEELEKTFTAQPSIPEPSKSLEVVMAQRPQDLLATEVAAVEEKTEEDDKYAGLSESQKERRIAQEERAKKSEDLKAEMMARTERNKDRMRQIEVIEVHKKKALEDLTHYKKERRRKEIELTSRNIKPDERTVKSELGIYDDRIENAEKIYNEAKDRIRELRLSME